MVAVLRGAPMVLTLFPLMSLFLTPSSASPELEKFFDGLAALNASTVASILDSINNQSCECVKSLVALTKDRKKMLLYLDAMGKPSSGLLAGARVNLFGSYSECTRMIEGSHYCLVISELQGSPSDLLPIITAPVVWGVCVPTQCSGEQIGYVVGTILSEINKVTEIGLSVNSGQCNKRSEYTTGVKITLVLCGIILSLCFAGTIIDLWLSFMSSQLLPIDQKDLPTIRMPVKNATMADDIEEIHHTSFERIHVSNPDETQNNGETAPLIASPLPPASRTGQGKASPVIRFFFCFSLIRNTNRILDTEVPPGAITSINGMRVLSMWWVILGHTFFFGQFLWLGNVSILSSLKARFSFEIIAYATLSVDTFFFLSGLLVSYLSIRHMEKTGGKLSLFKFYFLRFWRLTPTYAFVLLFFMQITGFLGEGPMWFLFQSNRACEKYWWTNLLYINNFYPTKFSDLEGHYGRAETVLSVLRTIADCGCVKCMGWSWYLANDMQFYVISPLILFTAYRFRLRGLIAIVGMLLIVTFVTRAILISHYDVSPFYGEPSKHDPESILYVKPYTRIASYLVGMVLGYILQGVKRWKTSKGITYIFNVIGWCLAIAISLSTIYGPYKTGRKHFTSAEDIMYGTWERFAWSLAVAWVIFACHRGLGGLVNSILSARFWIPLSRLTYCTYLIHVIVLCVRTLSLENPVATYSDTHVAFTFAGVVTISYGIAFILCVCVEYPMIQLGNLIFGKRLH